MSDAQRQDDAPSRTARMAEEANSEGAPIAPGRAGRAPDPSRAPEATAVEEALWLSLRGRWADALTLLDGFASRLAARPDADDGAMSVRLARCRLALVGGSASPEELRDLASAAGMDAWRARLELARDARRRGRPQEAAALLKEALDGFRAHAPALGDLATLLAPLVSQEVAALATDARGATDSVMPGDVRDHPLSTSLLLRLLDLGGRLARETDPERVLALVLDEAVAMMGADRGFVVRLEHGEMRVVAAAKLDRGDVETPAFNVSRTLVHEVARLQSPAFLSGEDIGDATPAGQSLAALGVASVACVPITGAGGVLGVLYMDSRGRTRISGGERQRLLRLLAMQAGIALENAEAHSTAALALERAEETIRRHRSEHELRSRYAELIGASAAMQEVYRKLDFITPTDMPVVILGETGTGKDVVARLIHARGPRADREFVAINCAGLTESLIETELFGHERGAFTGADRARPGLFEVADGGTLFLDEVGDMSPRVQADLLRVLQSGEVRRVGGRRAIHVDARILAATHRDLEDLVKRGAFRQDLYFRLNVLSITLPPVRDRPEDVPLLLDDLLARLVPGPERPRLSEGVVRRLSARHWPGNVREIENVLRRLLALRLPLVQEKDLPSDLLASRLPLRVKGTRQQAEAEALERALAQSAGNKAEAARILGVDRKTLYAMLRRMQGA